MILIENEKSTQRRFAVIAGSAMLIMAICAGYAVGFVNSRLISKHDSTATLSNVMQSQGLFLSGIFGWLIILICDVFTAWALCHFLSPVSKAAAQLGAWFRLLYCAVLSAAILNLFYVSLLLHGFDTTSPVKDLYGAQIMLYLDAFQKMWSFGLILFGLHLLIIGILVLRSGFIPKILGVLLLLAACSYLAVHLLHTFFAQFEQFTLKLESVLSLPMALGELVFALWILFKGGRITDRSVS